MSLFARVWVPDRPDPPTALLLHGFPGTELNFDLAHALRRMGFLLVLPHYRGSWGMAGTYSWAHVLEDTRACAVWMRSPEDRLYLVDAYIREFHATVVVSDHGWCVLSQTAFYPGGAGSRPTGGG